MIHVIAAPPGYWFLTLGRSAGDGSPLELNERLVIAWQVEIDGRPRYPILYGGMPEHAEWNSALELPDGRCIDDSNEIWPDRTAWLEDTQSNYEKFELDDAEVAS